MNSINSFVGIPRKNRPGLLSMLLNIVSHPAFAGYTPAGPGSLATGQSAAVARGKQFT